MAVACTVDGVVRPGAVGVLCPVPGVLCPVVECPADPVPCSVLVVPEDYSLIYVIYCVKHHATF